MLKRIILAAVTMLCAIVALLIYRQATHQTKPEFSDEVADQQTAPATGPADGKRINMIDVGQETSVGRIESPVYIRRDQQGRPTHVFSFKRRIAGSETMLEVTQPWMRIYTSYDRVIEITANTGSVAITDLASEMPKHGSLDGDVRIIAYAKGRRIAAKTPPKAQPDPDEPAELLVKLEQIQFEQEFSRISGAGGVTIRSAQLCADGSDLTLQYDQLNQRLAELEVRHVSKLYLSDREGKTKEPTAQEKDPTKEQVDEQIAEDEPSVVYRLTLTDDVVISRGAEELTADRIEVLADFSQEQGGSVRSDFSGEDDSRTNDDTAPSATATAAPTYGDLENMPLDPENMVAITCKGPLRLNVVDDMTSANLQGALEFIAYGQPAQIWRDGQIAVEADELHYDQVQNTMRLVPGADRPVRLTLAPDQWASAAGEVSVSQETNVATLLGPGRIEYQQTDAAQPNIVTYHDAMRVTFTDIGKGDGGDLSLLAGQIESLELVGQVSAVGEEGSFFCDHVLAKLEPDGQGDPQLRELIAEGSVKIDNSDYRVEADETLHIVLDNTQEPKKRNDRVNRGELGLDRLLGDGSFTSAVATGPAGGVRLTHKKEQYQVIGDRAEGSGVDNIWQVTGDPARIVSLTEQAALKELVGPLIRADMALGIFTVDGAGNLQMLTAGDFSGNTLDRSRPIRVTWQDRLSYHTDSEEITLLNAQAEIIESDEKAYRTSAVAGARMTLHLSRETDVVNEADQDLLGDRELDRMIVEGPGVEVFHHEYPEPNGPLLRTMHMRAPRLTFDNATEQITAIGAGWVEVSQYHATDNDAQKAEDASVSNSFSNVFDSSGPSYMLVSFGQDMRFHPDHGISFTGDVSLSHLPLGRDGRLDTDSLDGIVRIDCRDFDIKLDRNNRPRELQARGRVFLETIMDSRQRIIMGQTLTFDTHRNVFTVEGSESLPVLFDQVQFSRVRFDLNTGAIDADPLGLSELALQ